MMYISLCDVTDVGYDMCTAYYKALALFKRD